MNDNPPETFSDVDKRYKALERTVFKFTNKKLELPAQTDAFNFSTIAMSYKNDIAIVAGIFIAMLVAMIYWKPRFLCIEKKMPDGTLIYVTNYKYVIFVAIITAVITWYLYQNYYMKTN